MNRRHLAVVAAVVAMGLTLAGCNTSAGTVVGKSHRKAYTSCAGTPIVCSNTPECWRLDLRNDGTPSPGAGGGWPLGDGGDQGSSGSVCVSRKTWNAYPVGSYYAGGDS